MNIPDDLFYAATHEWLRLDGVSATVGVTDHAQHELSDVAYVQLPAVGQAVIGGQKACEIESVKAASEIFSPISGTITEVNELLVTQPALINTDPYGAGWIFRVSMEAGEEIEELRTPDQYRTQLGGGSAG